MANESVFSGRRKNSDRRIVESPKYTGPDRRKTERRTTTSGDHAATDHGAK